MNKEKKITLRVSEKDKRHLHLQAYFASMSVSELIRRKIKGIAIVPKVERMVLNEIRRQGGLLKNNFNTIKKSDFTNEEKQKLIALQVELLQAMGELVESVAKSYQTNTQQAEAVVEEVAEEGTGEVIKEAVEAHAEAVMEAVMEEDVAPYLEASKKGENKITATGG